jgi:signal transduction histidine kinase
MEKVIKFHQNKIFLKYYLIIASILLVVNLFLLYSYRSETQPKHKKTVDFSEIKKLTDKADIYFDNGKTDSAIYTFNKVVKLCDPQINTIDYVYALSCIAELQQKQSDYIASEESATAALPYLKDIKNPRYSWIVYNLLGINYLSSYDNKNAIFYFKKATKLNASPWRKYVSINNLVVVYMEQHKYKEAVTLLEMLVAKKHVSKDEDINDINYACAIDNLGMCHYKLGNFTKALAYYYEALEIRLKPKTGDGLGTSYRRLSLFFQKSNPKLARQYAQKAYDNALELNNSTEKVASLALLIESSQGNELKKHSLKYIQLADSINFVKKKTKNQFSNIKYNFNKDKKENLSLKTQKAENEFQLERQKKRIIIAYIIIVFVLGLVLFLSFHLTLKGKKEKNDAIYESETRISKKLHDELANDAYKTLAFAENNDLQIEENKEEFLTNLENLYSKTRNISKENSTIKTDEQYLFALKEMISGFKTPDINILLNGFDTIRWNEIEKNKKIMLYRVLQELFLNMKKHSKATLVSTILKISNKNITVTYTDNGVGTDNNPLILKNGLQNVENRIKTINGTIIFDNNSEKGFKLSFTFPV